MTTNTTTASQPNAAPSVDINSLLSDDNLRGIYNAMSCRGYEEGLRRARAYLKSAAPALPEPAAAQESTELLAELFKVLTLEQKNAVSPDFAKRMGQLMFDQGYRLVFNNWWLQAEPVAQPLAEVSAAQAVPKITEQMVEAAYKSYLGLSNNSNREFTNQDAMRQALEAAFMVVRAASPAAQAVPEGWQLAPIEPTEAMLCASISYREIDADDEILDPAMNILDRKYRAMLAAAPVAQPTDTTREA